MSLLVGLEVSWRVNKYSGKVGITSMVGRSGRCVSVLLFVVSESFTSLNFDDYDSAISRAKQSNNNMLNSLRSHDVWLHEGRTRTTIRSQVAEGSVV